MYLNSKIQWVFNGATNLDIEPVLFRLLHAILHEGSLKKSAEITRMSYRHAWGTIKKWEHEFNSPLVIFSRGRGKGAKLTELGEKLLWANRYLEDQIRPTLDSINKELNDSLADYLQPDKHINIKMYASHGLAVAHMYDQLAADSRFNIDYQVHGSLEALQSLNSGHCHIAGFHLPLELIHETVVPQYKHWISPQQHLLLTVSTRQQGIICRADNPKNIKTLRDLTKRSIRFVNRQRKSGTRTIFDELLRQEKIAPGKIKGYSHEEFTHVAVAAIIASGAADAGFGIKAVTRQFNLDFIPFLQEAYLLAIDVDINPLVITEIRKLLKSTKFKKWINRLPGNNASHSGDEFKFN